MDGITGLAKLGLPPLDMGLGRGVPTQPVGAGLGGAFSPMGGWPSGASAFEPSDPKAAPFSGQGATGKVAKGDIPLFDQGVLLADKLGLVQKTAGVMHKVGFESAAKNLKVTASKVWQQYTNPISLAPMYTALKPQEQRVAQATQLLSQPINTSDKSRYPNGLPTRAEVISAAAQKYKLDPAHVAGVILAEQRDQSANEDQVDIAAATGPMKANTSIGLGQITVATAKKDNAALLSDLLSPEARAKMSHGDVARQLQSEDHNIWATAKYMRQVADEGATKTAAQLPQTSLQYNKLDFKQFAQDSRTWGYDHIQALGSEYTSKPWDDKLSAAWGKFVADSVDDVRGSGLLDQGP